VPFPNRLEKHELKNNVISGQFYIMCLTHAPGFLIGLTRFIEKLELCNYCHTFQVSCIERAKITAEQKRIITKLI
jgi:hypothetical protein